MTRRGLLAWCSAAALTACSGGGGATAPLTGVPSPRTTGPLRRPEDAGAVGDGRTDDTAALQRVLAELRPQERLELTAGRTYLHSDVLVVGVPDVLVLGGGTLLAADESRSSLQVEADRVTVQDVRLAVRSTTRRWDAPAQHRLYVGAHTGVVLERVQVTGSAAAGVFLAGATDFLLADLAVSDTRADGVHLTGGSARGTVRAPHISRSGDDAVAVVSYLGDGALCHDIAVSHPRVDTTTGGRGLTVVGGEDVSYTDIDVRGSAAAAVYVACEGDPYNTFPTRRVQVRGGTVQGANTDAEIDHGSVLVYSGRAGGQVADVDIRDLRISGTRPSASRQVGVISLTGPASGVRLTGLEVEAAPQPFTSTSPDCCAAAGWTVAGRQQSVTS